MLCTWKGGCIMFNPQTKRAIYLMKSAFYKMPKLHDHLMPFLHRYLSDFCIRSWVLKIMF